MITFPETNSKRFSESQLLEDEISFWWPGLFSEAMLISWSFNGWDGVFQWLGW